MKIAFFTDGIPPYIIGGMQKHSLNLAKELVLNGIDVDLFHFVQKNFLLKLNLINITQPNWYGTRICKKKYLKSPQWIREIKAIKRPFYKFYKPKFDKFIFGMHFDFRKR